MSPSDKHSIDPELLASAIKKCNGSWIQKTLVCMIAANIAVIMFCIGQLMVNHRLLQDAVSDLREMKTTDGRIDKELAITKVTVAGHEVRITTLENRGRPKDIYGRN